jgi:probable DNA metabolism protein
MDNGKIIIYDGSFNGFLTAVYKAFDEKTQVADIQKNGKAQRGLFTVTETVFTQMDKAKKVWNGIQKKNNAAIENIYFAFLSESLGIELLLYRYIKKLFSPNDPFHLNFTNETEVRLGLLAKSVRKEKRRMETSVGFQLTQDDIHFANITPEYDVLPLISKYFRDRYSNQQWLIYDSKRNYGLYYDQQSTEIVSLDMEGISLNDPQAETDIKIRINTKLHKQPRVEKPMKYPIQNRAV